MIYVDRVCILSYSYTRATIKVAFFYFLKTERRGSSTQIRQKSAHVLLTYIFVYLGHEIIHQSLHYGFY